MTACTEAAPCPGAGPQCCLACRMYGPRSESAAYREYRAEMVDRDDGLRAPTHA